MGRDGPVPQPEGLGDEGRDGERTRVNLFLSCLTEAAPASNNRGESEGSRRVLQRISVGDLEYAVVSPEAIRAALRDMLREYGLPCNRKRERNEPQLAVSFQDHPDAGRFVDDFYFGYMVVQRDQIPEEKRDGFVYKRDSILRNNLAISLEPYRYESLLTQSPMTVPGQGQPAAPWSNAPGSALLRREVTYTRFQYPLALNLNDCQLSLDQPDHPHNLWFSSLLLAISELSEVAGGHTLSLFPMAPVTAVARLTRRLTPGFSLYPFQRDGSAPELLDALMKGRLPGPGLAIGGDWARTLRESHGDELEARGVRLHDTVVQMMEDLSKQICGRPLPQEV